MERLKHNETFAHDTNVVGTQTASRRNLESYSYDAAYRLDHFEASVSTGSSGSTSTLPTVPQTATSAGPTRFNCRQVTNPGAARNSFTGLRGIS